MVGSGDLVSALVVHYAMQLYVLHTAMYWADTCQVAYIQLTVGFRHDKWAYHLSWTEMHPHRQNCAQIHPETQTGAEILSCEASRAVRRHRHDKMCSQLDIHPENVGFTTF